MSFSLNGSGANYHVNSISEGRGKPVILVHGVAASMDQWSTMIPYLKQLGYQVYALDLLGHGDSAKPQEGDTIHIESMYAHLANWVSSLRLRQKPIFIGHSMGGYLSLKYSLRNPGAVSALALLSPFYSPNQLSRIILMSIKNPRISSRLLRAAPKRAISTFLTFAHANGDAVPKNMLKSMANDYKRSHPGVLRTAATAEDLLPVVNKVKIPTMVIWGEKDKTLAPKSFPKLTDALPNAVDHAIPKSGHLPHISKPEIVNPLVGSYLRAND